MLRFNIIKLRQNKKKLKCKCDWYSINGVIICDWCKKKMKKKKDI